jgi:arylsulfatase A-like enzyme
VLGGVAITGLRIYRERHVLATAPAPKPGLPNVLLIIWDTVRGQSMSVYGYGRPTTPYLEQFAREGARFDLAMATAPWTLPSHGAMFTGQRPRDLMRSISQPIVDSFPILAEVMTADGYATGGFVANMAYTTREHGLDRGFAHYDDYYVGWGNVVLASRLGNVLSDQGWIRKLIGTWNQPGRKNAALINQQFLDWQAGQKRRPFFAFLNYFDAHRPYISVEPYRSKFVRDTSGRFHPWMQHVAYDDLTEDEIRWANDEYDGTLAYQDEEVRKLMEELERRGVLQNTLVIVSSDHGEQFGDHKRMGHMNSLYRQLLQVPLLMRLPSRVPAGTVVSAPVSLRDLPKTVLDVAGISDTADFPGASLARYWSGHPVDSVALEPVFSEIGTRKGSGPFSLIKDDYHYIAWQGLARPTELYRLADDPFEENNVIALTQLTEVLKTFESWSELYMGKNVLVKRQGPVQDEENLAVPQ